MDERLADQFVQVLLDQHKNETDFWIELHDEGMDDVVNAFRRTAPELKLEVSGFRLHVSRPA